MNSLFQNNYESENDKRLDKKFSYNYQVIKNMYPKASELPEEEVRRIIRKYYQAPQGQEEQVIKNYISQKEPEWRLSYFTKPVNALMKNYFDMKDDNTVGNDDYFHCKAQFEAAQSSPYGEVVARNLGRYKEAADYLKNRFVKGLSPFEAYTDYQHDLDINNQGQHQFRSKLYENAKDACHYLRVDGINEKY